MIRNYLLVAIRNIRKHKIYAVINVLGLALGLAFCTLIFLYVRDEMTYDRFHSNADRIVRVYCTSYNADGSVEQSDPWLPMPLGPALVQDIPEVEAYTRLSDSRRFVRVEGEAVEENILFADPTLFTSFTFPLLRGNPETALSDLGNVVLSATSARKFFGDDDPIGRRLAIRLDDRFLDFTVTAIAADPPGNSSIPFGIVVPFENIGKTSWGIRSVDNWKRSGYMTLVLLRENTSVGALTEKLVPLRRKYYPDEASEKGEIPARYNVQSLADMHLSREVTSGLVMASNRLYSYILSGIALIVLLIACINFMTLAIGRSAGRAREIGVRKVVGANKAQLMAQFWGEAVLLSALALVLGLVLSGLFLPVFNELAGKSLRLDYATNAGTLAVLAALVLGTGLIAGSYPAIVLSGIRPVETLKNRFKLGGSRGLTRSLVVLQFALSVFLIVSTFVMLSQLRYVQTRDLGFDKKNLIVIPTESLDGRRALAILRNELADRPDVLGLTGVSTSFAKGYSRWGFTHEGTDKTVYVYGVESDFLDVLGIDLLAGRNFDPNLAGDSTGSVIINPAMARYFDWADPVGEIVSGLNSNDPSSDPTVIGVTEDFNFLSLHSPVEPAMLTLGLEGYIGFALVRIQPGNLSGTLAELRKTWGEVTPDVPFTYTFLDEDLQRQYEADARWSKIVSYASFFAVLIACLGLFGLASLAVAGRTKEIGIRKVLGATVSSVARLVSKEFLWLVLIGGIIAAPAAFFVMRRWLDEFAYRIDIGPGIFIIAAGLVVATAMLAVSYQSVKAALADPVKSLRYE